MALETRVTETSKASSRRSVGGASEGTSRRRGSGLRRLPDMLPALLDPAARRRGLAAARLLTEWAALVGPELAARCQPIRLAGEPGRAILHLHVAGSAALELQHSEPQLLQRINHFLGFPAVVRLKLIQAPIGRQRLQPVPPPPPPLSESERAAIDVALQPVEDPALRAALAALGETLRRNQPARCRDRIDDARLR